MKILIAGGGTGGHLMPALALARVAADQGHDVVLVGAQRGIEARILPHHPFRFHLLPIEPLYRRQWWRNFLLPLMWLRATRASNRVLRDERPDIVIGTGGYAAGPVVLRAQHVGIPTVLQEQNAFPGLTTRWLARRARQVHLGFPEARERLTPGPFTAVFVFGNPITPPPPPSRVDAQAARSELGLTARERTVFVFGGSQGARAVMNRVQPGEQRGARGTASRCVVELGEAQAALGERVKVRRLNLAAVASKIREAHVVRENDDDVRAGNRCSAAQWKAAGSYQTKVNENSACVHDR